ncbi:MAG: DUF177 domain-containing protein [Chloroflexota bacterium]
MGSPGLKVPLAAFLAESAGSVRHLEIDPTTIELDDDLVLDGPISGTLELSRTNRGIFIRGDLRTTLSMDCSRCLGPATVALVPVIREEVLPAIDPVTGQAVDPSIEPDVMRLSAHHELDVESLLREAVSLSAPIAPLCRPDCPGLCPECGARMADGHPPHDIDDIDPRLAALRGFRVDADAKNE